MRALNRLVGAPRHAWSLLARHAGPVASSSGIAVLADAFDAAPRGDFTVVVASLGVADWRDPKVCAWLRARRNGPMSLGAVSMGSVILARAGVLDGRRATVHWEAQAPLAAEHRAVDLVDALWRVDREVATAAGGTAAMDMTLALIAARDLAADIPEQFLHGPMRDGAERQRSDMQRRYGPTDMVVVHAVRMMEDSLEHPQRNARIAGDPGLSERQISRQFVAAMRAAPSDVYLMIRLKHARRRLVGSADILERIAEESGFSSLGHFSGAIKAWAGEPPSVFRRRAAAAVSPACKPLSG